MTSQIGALFKQAMLTFTCKSEIFHQNLEILRAILDKTTSDDVDLHPQFMQESLWGRPNKAPATYIDIYEDKNLSMGIFILKPGISIPLHDHPQIAGEQHSENSNGITAERNVDLIVDSASEPCVLDPFNGNLHEIESVGGPAAFLDVLAPPYHTNIFGNGPRKCTYYKILKEIAPKRFKLEEISAPSWFWSDTYPYTGPQIFT
ncbi:hypothetical protein FQR65_LT13072 [Abscondita terminalis]|nr:hypothetical protein FQR65_LT13072 [Abscondita terminalis]